ncbi:MAG: YlbF family regulator [Clostridiales bacterium]|nr:YlbF family regulator [Clostridiales bacterium]
MEKVLNQAELLGEAILESKEYIEMRLTEQAVMKDEEATLLIAKYSEKRSQVENLLANPNMDHGELAKAGGELQEVEKMLDANQLINKMRETNEVFAAMMDKVNALIKKVVTGEEEQPQASGCTGSCSSCAGCGHHH